MKTIIDGSKIMTAGMFVLFSPLAPWAMVAVITAGMIYNFRDKKTRRALRRSRTRTAVLSATKDL
jgi:hypothetical protein